MTHHLLAPVCWVRPRARPGKAPGRQHGRRGGPGRYRIASNRGPGTCRSDAPVVGWGTDETWQSRVRRKPGASVSARARCCSGARRSTDQIGPGFSIRIARPNLMRYYPARIQQNNRQTAATFGQVTRRAARNHLSRRSPPSRHTKAGRTGREHSAGPTASGQFKICRPEPGQLHLGPAGCRCGSSRVAICRHPGARAPGAAPHGSG